MDIARIIFGVILLLAAYWLPGAGFSLIFEWKNCRAAMRWISPILLSLVIVPTTLSFAATIWPRPPLLETMIAATACFAIAGFLLGRYNRRPLLDFRNRNARPVSTKETWFAGAGIVIFAAIAMLPRLSMLVNGASISTAIFSDTYWHLSELTAIARSGLAPSHFAFPDLPLVYYYWSWIYPAALSAFPPLGNSLLRLLNIQVAVNLLGYLVLLYAFLRWNVKSGWARGFALLFLTVAGGFDFFMSPNMLPHEWWQTTSAAIVSSTQISSPLTTYMWVPQHTAGMLAFLLILVIWRNLRGSLVLRGILVSVLAAFLFGTSVFVFLAICVAACVWAFLYRRLIFRKRAWPVWLILCADFFVLAGPQLLLSFNGSGVVRWGNFRVVLVEALMGTGYERAAWADQILTIASFPLVALAILAIEIGLPFLIFVFWAFRHAGRGSSFWRRFLSLFPMAYLPFAFFLLPPNFAMRGMIPVIAVMAIAAALFLEEDFSLPKEWWKKTALVYLFVLVAIAQCISPMVDWWFFARRSVAETFRLSSPVAYLPGKGAYPDDDQAFLPAFRGISESLTYITWANKNLPPDALIVEVGLPAGDNRPHLLERIRFLDPAEVAAQEDGQRDFTLAGKADLFAWWNDLPGTAAWEKVFASAYYKRAHPPVFVVSHRGDLPIEGLVVYRDDYVTIYQLPASEAGGI